ncbi:MAG: hypothetical protein QF921_07315 [Pseudomonadales bacterium]|jgi:hypothetical protein|nr:hypothetical protein [Pseudomonadales bacterium]MDP6469839.1 hypothetical protein [Pseudomonadales bacterium]MDP6827559.1 hypothetical protein [Pseudomonadales bacterium]MDP6971309.1 hypothetical protein [Pseudomonadales bacterium]|tara:strand:- start:435 stop:701 length:267 start_codon:yes stop_codon:yes gene_type:complete
MSDEKLTNHEITVCLAGGAVLGPFKATWSRDIVSDVRELTKDFDAYMESGKQSRYKYHLHDQEKRISHSLILKFKDVTAIYDRVELKG